MSNRTIKTRLRFNFAVLVLFCSFVFLFCVSPHIFFSPFLLFAGFHLSARCCTVAVIFVVVFIS